MNTKGFKRRSIKRGKRLSTFEAYVIATFIFCGLAFSLSSLCFGIILIIRSVLA